MAVRQVVGQRMGSWYRPLEFRNGSVVTMTGFTVYKMLTNDEKERLKYSISNTLSLFEGNVSLLVDRYSIVIIREFLSMSSDILSSPLSSQNSYVRVFFCF